MMYCSIVFGVFFLGSSKAYADKNIADQEIIAAIASFSSLF